MISKWPVKHNQALRPKPKHVVTAYMSATFGQNMSNFFDLLYSREQKHVTVSQTPCY